MRRALCVGIDQYPGIDASLIGCVSDATSLGNILRKHENNSPNFETRILTAALGDSNTKITATKLREEIGELLEHPADAALFSFSGHGTENNLGGFLVTQDAKRYHEGVQMQTVIDLANQSPVKEVVILLDCCHSGHMGNPPAIDNQKSLLREGVSILTASRGAQVSVGEEGGGLFTSLVVDALGGGAADIIGHVTAPAIYGYLETALGAWDQRPLFKSHVSTLVPLRKCHPAVELNILRELPTLFPLPAEDLLLSPKYEQTAPDFVISLGAIFEKLQALNRVHLVIPVAAPHMYDAAMSSARCRLTASGRYYWRLARDGRI
jgi:Caspase domain